MIPENEKIKFNKLGTVFTTHKSLIDANGSFDLPVFPGNSDFVDSVSLITGMELVDVNENYINSLPAFQLNKLCISIYADYHIDFTNLKLLGVSTHKTRPIATLISKNKNGDYVFFFSYRDQVEPVVLIKKVKISL